MPTEMELFALRLMLKVEELNSSNISQRMNALLDLEEQWMFALDNIKRRQQIVKRYFNKSVQAVKFKVNEKVLPWDSTHVDRGRHSKFQKLWLGPFKIAFVLNTNSYILKDLQNRLFSYSTNRSHLKHYVECFVLLILFYFVVISFCCLFLLLTYFLVINKIVRSVFPRRHYSESIVNQ
jgi:hypothetical protein